MNAKQWHGQFNYPVEHIKAEIEAQRLIRSVSVNASVFRPAANAAARAAAQPFCAAYT